MGGTNRFHSNDRVFLTEFDGINFWVSILEQWADQFSDSPFEEGFIPAVVICHFPETGSKIDWRGSEDSKSLSVYLEKKIPRSKLSIWEGWQRKYPKRKSETYANIISALTHIAVSRDDVLVVEDLRRRWWQNLPPFEIQPKLYTLKELLNLDGDDSFSWLEIEHGSLLGLSKEEREMELRSYRGNYWASAMNDMISERKAPDPLIVVETKHGSELADGRGRVNLLNGLAFNGKMPVLKIKIKRKLIIDC